MPAFDYLGTSYSSVVMSSNGFVVVGSDTTNAATPFNTDLPDRPAVGSDLEVDFTPGSIAKFTFQADSTCDTGPVVNVARVTSASSTVAAFAATDVVRSSRRCRPHHGDDDDDDHGHGGGDADGRRR